MRSLTTNINQGGGGRGRTVKEKGGLADAAGTVKDDRLRDAVVYGVVVKDRLEERPRDDPPPLGRRLHRGLRRLRRRGTPHVLRRTPSPQILGLSSRKRMLWRGTARFVFTIIA